MIFPYKFASKKNLEYSGSIPSCDYFYTEKEWWQFRNDNSTFNFKEYSIKYCINDVEITSIFMKMFNHILLNQNIDVNRIYSAPSLSFQIFEKKYNKKRADFNMNMKDDEIIRSSYFGGRCEVYGNPIENEHIHYYDFSGMYGQCMMEKFPYGKLYREKNPINFDIPGFYYIIYNSSMYIPVLPHKSKINGKLMFCNGINEGLF